MKPHDAVFAALPLLLAPLLVFPRPWAVWILPIVPLAAAARLLTAERHHGRTPADALLVLLLVAVGMSLLATPRLSSSLGKVSGACLGVLTCWGVASFAGSRARFAAVLGAWLAAGAALALGALVGARWEVKYEFVRPIVDLLPVRFAGLPGAQEGFNPNPLGAVLAMILPASGVVGWECVRGRAVEQPRMRRAASVFAAAACALMAFVLLLSQSRAAVLGLAVGLALLAIGGRAARWARLAAVGACGVAIAAAGAATTDGGSVTLRGRLELWLRALSAIEDVPITGTGMNIFRDLIHVLYPPFAHSPDVAVPHAHNGILQAALDLGLPGMIVWVALWSLVVTLLVRVWRRGREGARRRVAGALLAGIVALVVFEVTDTIGVGAKVGILWWVMAGLALAIHRLPDDAGDDPASSWQPAVGAGETLLLWLAASAAAVLAAPWSAVAAVGLGALSGAALGVAAAAGVRVG